MSNVKQFTDVISQLKLDKMYEGDFFLTWEKSFDEIKGVFAVADALRHLRENNISARIFDSGLGISLFRDNSTRTRFSFASACNLLGLEVQDLDEGKSQIAHGETVRETASMISFMADVIGIRDDMYIGKGNTYMHNVVNAVTEGHRDGVLEQKPTLVNLQCDIDHPTQVMADTLHLIHEFGGIENLKGKKVAVKRGTEGYDFAESIKDQYGFETVVFDTSDAMCMDVKVGNSVACFEDYPVLGYGITQGNGLKMVTDKEQGSSYGFAVGKGENAELLKMFNTGLANLKENGKYQEILDTYIQE